MQRVLRDQGLLFGYEFRGNCPSIQYVVVRNRGTTSVLQAADSLFIQVLSTGV